MLKFLIISVKLMKILIFFFAAVGLTQICVIEFRDAGRWGATRTHAKCDPFNIPFLTVASVEF